MRLPPIGAVLFGLLLTASAQAVAGHPFVVLQNPILVHSKHGRSQELRHLPIDRRGRPDFDIPVGKPPRPPPIPAFIDPIRQDWTAWYDTTLVPAGLAAPTPLTSFGGVNESVEPPDPDGAVGPNHYVQVVNFAVTIFDKTGAILRGPVGSNTIWAGLPGVCSSDISGDATVLYDSSADRWVISQMAGFEHLPDSHQCVAVSATGDPLGAYNLYQIGPLTNKNDYPKLAVWPDGYYLTYNEFQADGTFVHTVACALDRASMIQGVAMRDAQCMPLPVQFNSSLLPADLDGARLPPSGAPNYLAALIDTNAIGIWQFFVSWTNPASTSLAGPTTLQTAPFSDSGGTEGVAPQAGTTNLLETLGDRLMYRLAYRNFGDHEALVANHTVSTTVGGATVTGLRWYEVRISNGIPTLFQQSTYAPDGDDRFMGSAALDQSGNMAIGFTLSGSGRFPEIRYTGRIAIDTLNGMTQGDNTAIASAGFQDGTSNLKSRWGDYTRMTIDPVDDCTFWYTSEYLTFSGEDTNWKTWLQSFKLPGCPTPWFSLSASPTSTDSSTTIFAAGFAGFSGAISLIASGLPQGATASFSPSAIGAGAGSTLTLNPGTSVAGQPVITVTGTEGGVSRTTTVTWNNPGCTPLSVSEACSTKCGQTVSDGCTGTITCPPCACNSANCGGCCDANQVCHARSNSFCGISGSACNDCTAQGDICLEVNTCTGQWACTDPTCRAGCPMFCP